MERWLADCLTEVEGNGDTISKEELWGSFFTYMNVDSTVGRATFFPCLGIALANIGYHRVTPVFKKRRRLGYKGLTFKANISIGYAHSCNSSKK